MERALHVYVFGLTGGTGSGKSTAAARFAEHGLPVIDADRIGHELIAPGGRAEAPVIAAFGEGIVTCGKIDRAALGGIVFADPEALAQLNEIVHPLLAEEIGLQCVAHAASGAFACIIDAALLGEGAALEPWLDALVLVVASVAACVERLTSSRGLDEGTARTRIAAQVDPDRKRALARWIIENDGSLPELHARVDAVLQSMKQFGRSRQHDDL